jgi:outer membrane lipoprotein-sorting protein
MTPIMSLRRTLLVALAAMGLARTADAAPPPAPSPLAPADQALTADAAHYLDGLTEAEGRFVQTDGAGRQATGSFWIQRPGLARFDYDPPSGLSVASDGHLVSQVNHQLKTIQSLPLGATPLSILLARNIRLDGKVEVRKVTATDKAFAVEMAERGAGAHGKIVLQFSRDPIALAGWALTDARGQTINVRLTRLVRAAPRPKAFFNIYDPSLHGPRPQDGTPLS